MQDFKMNKNLYFQDSYDTMEAHSKKSFKRNKMRSDDLLEEKTLSKKFKKPKRGKDFRPEYA